MIKIYILFIISLFIVNATKSQQYPDNYFISPLDIPLYLSGSFGELRTNHFHSGIDIKTMGVEGKKVYAVADGYVSRIKVSPYGYGKAIYITHPNGYVSVYGHLKKFNDSLQKYVKTIQYKRKRYDTEIYPEKYQFKVKKGEFIAYSGNSGGSVGPHLHFELREESTQYPVNPLLFKSIKIKDYTRPVISAIAFYPEDENASINGKNDTLYLKVEGWGEKHRLANNKQVKIKGNVSFGIRCYDKMNDIKNKNGIYEIDLTIDGHDFFGLKMDKLSFSTTRYINSLIDYEFFIKNSKRYYRTKIDSNNKLFVYTKTDNNGVFNFSDELSHNIKFVVKDAYKNTSSLSVEIITDKSLVKKVKENNSTAKWFNYNRINQFTSPNLKINFPAKSFYRSFYFKLDSSPAHQSYSKIYHIHNSLTPVQKYFYISIKPQNFPDNLKSKLYLAYSYNNIDFSFAGCIHNNGFISAKSRNLGFYKIMADTVLPKIKILNFNDNKIKSNQKTLRFKAFDKQSGLKSYNAWLNDNWILLEYDAKNDLFTYEFDNLLLKGKNKLKIILNDNVNNKLVVEREIIY